MQPKDYYKVLDISQDASEQDVKKAFRIMAKKYHPDTGGDGAHQQEQFRICREAYAVLTDTVRREKYDEERWLAGMSKRVEEKDAITPMWILEESLRLNNHMGSVDVYRMSHLALHDYIMNLLDDDNLQLLQDNHEKEVNKSIIRTLLQATRSLKYIYMQPVAEKLIVVGGEESVSVISDAMQGRRRQALWERRMPYVIALITMIIVVSMYFWAMKN